MAKKPNKQEKGLKGWIETRLPIFSFIRSHLVDYQTPINLNVFWNFGSLAGIILLMMIASGLFLAMHYHADVAMAFDSIETIMRDVNYGWLLRYLHANGASMLFIVVYIHMLRGLYYGSYKSPRELLWLIGVLILVLLMMTAFVGYVLPWGQMSYWAITVITNLFSAFPLVGESIVHWMWGGYVIGDPALGRFFVFHFLLPFVILGVAALHLVALHQVKSNNPAGVEPKNVKETIPFHPYHTISDLFFFGLFLLIYLGIVFFAPGLFVEPDNYIRANPLLTPSHITPEWYFLPFYAVLRAVPDKLGGVLAMFGSVFVLFLVPWLDRHKVKSAVYRPLYRQFFWLFVANCFLLGWLGGKSPEGGYVIAARIAAAYHFMFFLVVMPLLTKFERAEAPPSITASLLARRKGKG